MIINCRYLTQNLTGVQRFGFEITKRMVVEKADVELVSSSSAVKKAYHLPSNFKLTQVGRNSGHIWEQYDLRNYLRSAGNPLLLNLGNTAPLFYKRQIITVHDLAFLHTGWHSKMFRYFYKYIVPQLLKNSLHIITVSNFSKSEIIKHYKIAQEKISVVYNAPYNALLTNDNILKPLTDDRFILAVGSMDPRKNLKALIKAFNKIRDKELYLYLIGGVSKNYNGDKELFSLINNNKMVKFLGYQTDEALNWYYKNAVCFVFPTLYEGFGLPPIEAMAKGCPTIVSNRASLPEVCGDAAIYFDPANIDDIYEKITYFLDNLQLKNEMCEAGLDQAAKYSWATSGRAVNTIVNILSN